MLKEVSVIFNRGRKLYSYVTDIEDIKIGDAVVVDTSNGLAVAWIKELSGTGEYNPTKWVISKVDVQAFKDKHTKINMAKDNKAIRDRIEFLMNSLKYNPRCARTLLAYGDSELRDMEEDFAIKYTSK